MTMPTPAKLPCALLSLDVGEPAFATAVVKTDLWLLVELDGQWAPEALDSPGIPEAVRAHIRGFLDANPTARFQLIRSQEGRAEPGATVFLVRSGEQSPGGWHFDLSDLSELTTVDLSRLADDPSALPQRHYDGPLFLVCTHGKRDACCARLGVPVFSRLEAQFGQAVWMTSHLGGHRFAATILLLPTGHCYGRLDEAAAVRVVEGYLSGTLTDLDCYRGRTCYARPVQAAEYYLRLTTGIYTIGGLGNQLRGIVDEGGLNAPGGLHYTRGELLEADRWQLCFEDPDSGEIHELTIARTAGPEVAPKSCHGHPEPVLRYALESHRQLMDLP